MAVIFGGEVRMGLRGFVSDGHSTNLRSVLTETQIAKPP